MRNTNQPMLLISLTDAMRRINVDLKELLAHAKRSRVIAAGSKRKATERPKSAPSGSPQKQTSKPARKGGENVRRAAVA